MALHRLLPDAEDAGEGGGDRGPGRHTRWRRPGRREHGSDGEAREFDWARGRLGAVTWPSVHRVARGRGRGRCYGGMHGGAGSYDASGRGERDASDAADAMPAPGSCEAMRQGEKE